MKPCKFITSLVLFGIILLGTCGVMTKGAGAVIHYDDSDHNWDDGVVTKEPTCTEPGEKTYSCVNSGENTWDGCGETKIKTIDPLGHDFSVIVKTVAPTCKTQGYTVYKCSRCDKTENRDFIAADGVSHNMQQTFFQAATCEAPGMETLECTLCGHQETKNYDATGHKWVEESRKEATCGEDGYIRYKCTNMLPTGQCSAHKEDPIKATGKHQMESTFIQPATCDAPGMEKFRCKTCGYEEQKNYDATGHDWVKVETVPATCQNQGYTIYKCNNCGKTENRDIVPKTDNHDLKESILKQPTCTADGEKQVYCTVCDYNEKAKIPATGHNWKSEVILKQPTCEEPGEEEMICTKCGTEGPRQAIPATGHNWDEGKVTKEAEVYVEGEITYTCKNDPSHTKVEKIPALPDENGNVTPPDPDGNGDGQDGQNGNGDGQNGQNGEDGQNGNNGQDGTDGTIGSDGKNSDGTVGNADGSNGNGSGTDKNGNGGNGSGNGSSDTNKKSSNLWLILLIIFLLLFGLAAVIILAVRKLKSQRD